MYCSKCGKLIEDESRFCNGCGSPVGGQAIANNNNYQTIVDSAANSRLKAMAEINRMIEYYSPKQQQYDELDVCRDKLKFYNDRKSYFVVKGVSSTSVFWVLGIISFAMCLFAMVYVYIAIQYKKLFYSPSFIPLMNVGVVLIMTAAIFAAIGALFFVIAIIKFKSNNRKIRDFRNSQLSLYEQRYEELANELEDHFLAYGYCETGSEYTNPKILNALSKYIYSGRAITIQEAINLLHLDAHNTKMELQAEIIAMNTALAAHYARKAAFFSAASFFF